MTLGQNLSPIVLLGVMLGCVLSFGHRGLSAALVLLHLALLPNLHLYSHLVVGNVRTLVLAFPMSHAVVYTSFLFFDAFLLPPSTCELLFAVIVL